MVVNLRVWIFVAAAMMLVGQNGIAQSAKAKKMYQHFENSQGSKARTIPKDLFKLGLAFIKGHEALDKIAADVSSIKLLSLNPKPDEKELNRYLPGRKMALTVNGMSEPLHVWVKRGLLRVKEAHLIWETGRKTTIVSAFGNFKPRDIKEVNDNFIQKGGLSNIPVLPVH